jgi:hypothetical protein
MNHKTIKQTPSISVFGEYNNVFAVTLKRSDASFYNSYFIPVCEELEDTKAVIRIRISKKHRQHNALQKSRKEQTTIYKTYTYTKDRVTCTPLKTWSELRCSGRVHTSCSTRCTRRVTLVKIPLISHEWGKDRLRRVEHIFDLSNLSSCRLCQIYSAVISQSFF